MPLSTLSRFDALFYDLLPYLLLQILKTMAQQKCGSQVNLEIDSKSSFISNASTLQDLLPEADFEHRLEEIRKNFEGFLLKCRENNNLVLEMIDKVLASDEFGSVYEKKLANLSVQALAGDMGDAGALWVPGESEHSPDNAHSNVPHPLQIQQQIEADENLTEAQFYAKYGNLAYLLGYMCRPPEQIKPVCVNYLSKIVAYIVSARPWDFYAYLSAEPTFSAVLDGLSAQDDQPLSSNANKPGIVEVLVSRAKHFPGISEMMGKIIAEEGLTNQFPRVKSRIVDGFVAQLKSEDTVKSHPDTYIQLLDFVAFVFSRNKYKSEDATEMLAKVTQRFVQEDIIEFYKEKVIRSVIDSKSMQSETKSVSSSGNLSSRSRADKQASKQNLAEYSLLQNIFENSVAYLKLVVERLNSDQQIDAFMGQSAKLPEPTMEFQVDQAFYGSNSLYELMMLHVPARYKSINKMSYYEFLVKLSRNSRYKRDNVEAQMGLLPSFVVSVLCHLLNAFRKETRNNGLIKFYLLELITEAVLPRVGKLEPKQAMMVISALNPSKDAMRRDDDNRIYLQKIFLTLEDKCEWFGQHFTQLGVNLGAIKEQYKLKIAGNSPIFEHRANKIKEFQFLYVGDAEEVNHNTQREDKFNDDYKSSSEDEEPELNNFQAKRNFNYPDQTEFRWDDMLDRSDPLKKTQDTPSQPKGDNSDLEGDLMVNKSMGNEEISEEIHQSPDQAPAQNQAILEVESEGQGESEKE